MSYMWKRLCLESCFIKLWKCKIFSKYYDWFSSYLWWNYRVIYKAKCEGCEAAKDARLSLKDHDEEETNFNEKKTTCKMQNLYILLAFLLIAKALFDKISSKTKTFITIQLYK